MVGKPYGFFESLKLKGTGSKRMIVDEVSPNLKSVINVVDDINYENIELRPQGILIHFTKGHKNFTWAIPYYQLVIYKINGSSIHAQGKFVHFRNNKTFKENKKFSVLFLLFVLIYSSTTTYYLKELNTNIKGINLSTSEV